MGDREVVKEGRRSGERSKGCKEEEREKLKTGNHTVVYHYVPSESIQPGVQ